SPTDLYTLSLHDALPISAAGSSSSMVMFFHAKGLKKIASGGGDETENITVHEVPLDGIDDWLKKAEGQGLLVDPKVYTALYFVRSEEHTSELQSRENLVC